MLNQNINKHRFGILKKSLSLKQYQLLNNPSSHPQSESDNDNTEWFDIHYHSEVAEIIKPVEIVDIKPDEEKEKQLLKKYLNLMTKDKEKKKFEMKF